MHIRDMLQLQDKHPDVAKAFTEGKFQEESANLLALDTKEIVDQSAVKTVKEAKMTCLQRNA